MAIQLIDNFRFSHKPVSSDAFDDQSRRGRMVEALANRLYLSDGGAFLITGYRGVGKTTFVHDVLTRLEHTLNIQQSRGRKTPELLDVYLNIARPLSGVELMHFILRQLHNRLADLRLLGQLPRPLRAQLRLAFLRTSAMLALSSSREAEASLSLEKWLSFSSKLTSGTSRDINYLAYDERSAENDLIALAQQLVRGFRPDGWQRLLHPFAARKQLKLLFVFDELDKIEESSGNESSLTDILHSLKTLFTTSGISFIFVAGRALHERWQQDVQRGDSVYESVFSESRYLPAVWDQVDHICDPFLADRHLLSEYDRQLYNDFKRYLAYTGRGIPRRILRGFYERVRWDGFHATLSLSEKDRRQMRFHAELYQLLTREEEKILGEQSRELRPDWLDKQRLGLYYILDWILSQGPRPFTLAQLIDAAAHELKAGIAPAQELAPRVVTGLLDLLCENQYVKRFTDIDETQLGENSEAPEKFRLLMRRLIEMGRYRDQETPPSTDTETKVLSDRYQVLEKLGQGASAQVFRAVDRQSGRIVAIKYFNADFFSADSSLQDRLRAEVAVQRKLNHSGIAKMLEVSFEGDTPFIVMEFLEGVTLHRLLQNEGKLPVPRALSIMRSLLDTLHYLHSQGIIWRDVKPSNILITTDSRIVIIDFGTAQTVKSAQSGPDTTRLGFAVGTPAYMSPEQIRGESQSAASDIFSLGIILYEMLTGDKPWPVSTPLELYRELESRPVSQLPGLTDLPEKLRQILSRALTLDPDQRYPTAQAMLEALPHSEPDDELGSLASSARQSPYQDMELEEDQNTWITPAMAEPEFLWGQAQEQSRPEVSAAAPAQPSTAKPEARKTRQKQTMKGAPANVMEVDLDTMTHPRGYALLTITEPDKTRHVGLFGDKVALGRSAECDIQLEDNLTSRFHATIHREKDHFVIKDLNSNNGLFVNGKRVYQTHRLNDNDDMTIGRTRVVFSAPERHVVRTSSDSAVKASALP
ncbi:MAG: protein kinase [Ketobacteraceae bacterium]|nr:protein kinase [Ketobacteraceae bacterium]